MKFSKTKLAVFLSVTLVLIAAVTITAFAYFSTRVYVYTNDGNKNVAHLGMNLSLLFDKLNSGTTDGAKIPKDEPLPFINPSDTNPDDGIYFKFDPEADWGSAQNPYVISDIRHLQNLSALQDIGYFDEHFIQDNFQKADGNLVLDANGERIYIAGSNVKPYFLICTSIGTPVTINGTGVVIKPIGNEEFPFIGEIGGAFVEGTTTVNGLSSDTSTIFNITVQSKISMPDHGLFGHISYLGQSPDEVAFKANAGSGKFLGYVSKVSDILMADVSLVVYNKVDNTNLWDTFVDWVGHIFSFTETGQEEDFTIPHETNHIGILAGHVTYTDVNNISVYYSDDNKVCIDLHDLATHATEGTNANYFSSTGIIGYIYSMNPQYEDNVIKIGTGSSTASVGSLGGGGSASGVNPGYVLAKSMYDLYSQYSKPPRLTQDGLPTYKRGTDADLVCLGIKITVTVVDGELRFMDEMGHILNPSGSDPNRTWQYVDANNNIHTLTLPSYSGPNDTPYFYCQIEAVGLDSDGNDIYKPVYYSTITGVEDGKAVGNSQLNDYSIDAYTQVNSNDLYIYSAKDENGENLCAQWYRDRLILGWFGIQEATGRYYFYDGVFTFALSNMRDVIREVWPVTGDGLSTVPFFTLAGEGDWTTGEIDVDTYQATLTPATSIDPQKTYMLAYEGVIGGATQDEFTTELFFMNLMSGGSGNAGQFSQTSFTDLLGTNYTAVSDGNGGYVIELGKGSGRNLLNSYTFIYQNNIIHSSADANTKLGIHSVATGTVLGTSVYHVLYSGNGVTGSDGENWNSANMRPCYNYNLVLSLNGSNATVAFNPFDYYVYSAIGSFVGSGEFKETQSTSYLSYSTQVWDSWNEVWTDTNEYTLATRQANAGSFKLFEVNISLVRIHGEEIGMVPKDDATTTVEEILYADQYVLYPQSILTGTDTADLTSPDPVYGLIHVGQLGAQLQNETWKGTWRYSNGDLLADLPDGMKYMFDLVEGAKYGTVNANILGGDWDGGGGFVKATLGTDGSQTYIPMGCISFKVNKDPAEGDPIKIRVIVAVPTSGSPNGLSYNKDYYFALWQNKLDSGQSATFNFEENGALAKFELPRSQPLYDGEGNLKDQTGYNNPIKVRRDVNGDGLITDADGTTVYNTYFQGETVLVAYEFTVDEAGVYTIGATNGPMQIVYFSADGVASLGRDGTGGSHLQGIDFVYHYGQNIVTVTNIPNTTDPTAGDYVDPDTENYNYYYESSCLLHLDNEVRHNNEFVRIYHEKIYIRRYVDESDETAVQNTFLSFAVTDGAELSTLESNRYVKLEKFAQKSDTIIIRDSDIYKKSDSTS